MPITIIRDFSAAIRRTQELKSIPEVSRKALTKWAAESVKDLKRRAMDMKKSKHKTGQLARSIGMSIGKIGENTRVTVGTGVGGGVTSKYARIQDEGGVITKKSKMLTIPLNGVQGKISNYPDGFFIKSRKGNVLFVVNRWKKVRGGLNSRRTGGLIPLFVLKDQVTIPATHWFSGPMDYRLAILDEMISAENLLAATREAAN